MFKRCFFLFHIFPVYKMRFIKCEKFDVNKVIVVVIVDRNGRRNIVDGRRQPRNITLGVLFSTLVCQ